MQTSNILLACSSSPREIVINKTRELHIISRDVVLVPRVRNQDPTDELPPLINQGKLDHKQSQNVIRSNSHYTMLLNYSHERV